MHYKNGREAKPGDVIVHPAYHGGKYHATRSVLLSATPGSDTCNGNVIPLNTPTISVNLKDCLHAEDAGGTSTNPAEVVPLPAKAEAEQPPADEQKGSA